MGFYPNHMFETPAINAIGQKAISHQIKDADALKTADAGVLVEIRT